jgi:hypothetical protein
LIEEMQMAKTDRPWWGNNDPLSGGETFKSAESRTRKLGVASKDLFRVEKTATGNLTLLPHKDNVGTWKATHNKNNPIQLTPVPNPEAVNPNIERAFSMTVTIKPGTTPEPLFLVEFKTGKVSIKKKLQGGGGNDDGTCSVER